jgi:hypothetical protein
MPGLPLATFADGWKNRRRANETTLALASQRLARGRPRPRNRLRGHTCFSRVLVAFLGQSLSGKTIWREDLSQVSSPHCRISFEQCAGLLLPHAPRNIDAVRNLCWFRKNCLTPYGSTAHCTPPKVLRLVMNDTRNPFMDSPSPTSSRPAIVAITPATANPNCQRHVATGLVDPSPWRNWNDDSESFTGCG